jgi:predicted PurR-regulated permease PerM
LGGIDNLLYPLLIGNRLKMHTILAFISVVGGLMLFGPPGLILGPVALTVAIVLLDVWHLRRTEGADAHNRPEALAGVQVAPDLEIPQPMCQQIRNSSK